jgi:predicted RNA-binding Zn ribbon-like protein
MNAHMPDGSRDSHAEQAALHEFGGRHCLALANTVLWRRSERRDILTSYPALVRFVVGTGAFEAGAGSLLEGLAAAEPAAAEAALRRAVSLRETLYRVFAAIAGRYAPSADDLAELNAAVADAARHAVLVPDGSGFAWAWRDADTDLTAPLWPALRSAADMLASPELDRVKQCPGPTCGWLFLDQTRSRTRRWCEPHLCGARERSRAHYARRRGGRP